MSTYADSTIVSSYQELVTTREQTRTGFLNFALEKNRRSIPFIQAAKALRCKAIKVKLPMDLMEIEEIRPALLMASGLSVKSLNYLTEDDKSASIQQLITQFLEPEGGNFVDELVYRYLLTSGDALGGKMRNIVGQIAQMKLLQGVLANIKLQRLESFWWGTNMSVMTPTPDNWSGILPNIKAISWMRKGVSRILLLNWKIPAVATNIDLCLLSYIGAAIEERMALEIYEDLCNGRLTQAINLNVDEQLNAYCDWLITL